MSTNQQIQKSILDVLSVDKPELADWSQGYLKKLAAATGTLYNASLNKVVLKQTEETARCHICAFMACQKLQEKSMPDLDFYMDNIPLEPKSVRHIISVFKQNLFQMSPVKSIQWSVSPKKSRKNSPVKNNDRFTAADPKQLRQELFGTPTKRKSPSREGSLSLSVTEALLPLNQSNEPKSVSATPRRKLAFEEDDSADEKEEATKPKETTDDSTVDQTTSQSIFGQKTKRSRNLNDPEDSPEKNSANEKDDDVSEERESTVDIEESPSPSKRAKKKKLSLPNANLLQKKFYKVKPAQVIDLCNVFELPKDVAFHVLDEYFIHSNYLIYTWQLLCGLVMNCVFVAFNERRLKDPRMDHLIMEKMVNEMNCDSAEEVVSCIRIVNELITGQKWFRDLQIANNYYEGHTYNEMIASKLGSMLQRNNILVSDEQYDAWRRGIEQDLSLRPE